jgi:hypothetical protein
MEKPVYNTSPMAGQTFWPAAARDWYLVAMTANGTK